MSDILAIKRALTDRAAEVAAYLLPNGVKDGREWVVGSVNGEAGKSLKVCISGAKVGTWADFAEGGEGGDAIDLWCAVRHLALPEALDEIRDYLGMEKPRFERQERQYRRPDRPKCTVPASAVLAYLTGERKLSADAVRAYRVGEQGRTIVFPSLLPDGVLAFVKYLGVDRPGGKKQTRVEAECEPVLFGWQAIDPNAREVAITEGEIDAMTAWDYGFPALSVPFGGGKGNKQAWIAAEYDRLLRFEVIYLALDMDAVGDEGVAEIVNRLGRHRCRRVELPHKDLNQCRQEGVSAETIRQCFDQAKTQDPPELQRSGAYVEDVVSLFWPSAGTEPGYRMPFAKIRDTVILRPAELSIWTGPSGSGKSQVLSHAIVGWGEQGARVCLASLEMAPKQTLRRMVKQAGNVDRPTEPFIRKILGWFDDWLWVMARVGKAGVSEVLEVFDYARCRYGCDVFVIDSLMRLGIGSEDYEGQEKAVYQMVNWAVDKGVHLHLVAHSRKGDKQSPGAPETEDIKGASEIGSNAFNIFGMWRNRKAEDQLKALSEKAENGDVAAQVKLEEIADMPPVVLNVAKQRNGDWEGKLGLWFNQLSYQYRCAQDDRHGMKYISMQEDIPEEAGTGW